MLSYRHSYHAGNFADVLKHLVQVAVLDHLRLKAKPFLVHDTHGGAGLYAVNDAHMQKTGEYRDGIGRLRAQRVESPLINRYLNLVAGFSPPGRLSHYPGSPALSAVLLREQDRLQVTELHGTDFEALRTRFQDDRRIRVEKQDALAGIKALLPPVHKRGLVLIDPSYELGGDEAATLETVEEGLRRFNTGCFAIWYPVLDRRRADRFARRLLALAPRHLRAELCVHDDRAVRGMTGSGMVVLNPPWPLTEQLRAALPVLHGAMNQGGGGHQLVQADGPRPP